MYIWLYSKPSVMLFHAATTKHHPTCELVLKYLLCMRGLVGKRLACMEGKEGDLLFPRHVELKMKKTSSSNPMSAFILVDTEYLGDTSVARLLGKF